VLKQSKKAEILYQRKGRLKGKGNCRKHYSKWETRTPFLPLGWQLKKSRDKKQEAATLVDLADQQRCSQLNLVGRHRSQGQ
jgi:hypothetical protein